MRRSRSVRPCSSASACLAESARNWLSSAPAARGSSEDSPAAASRIASVSRSASACLSRYPLAPAITAPTIASSSEYEVSITTRTSGWSALIRRQASTPLLSGRRTSISTTSGRTRPARATASAAVSASPTTRIPGAWSSSVRSPIRTT